jgi:hypothetical protein
MLYLFLVMVGGQWLAASYMPVFSNSIYKSSMSCLPSKNQELSKFPHYNEFSVLTQMLVIESVVIFKCMPRKYGLLLFFRIDMIKKLQKYK